MQQKVLAKKGILYGLATVWGVLLTIILCTEYYSGVYRFCSSLYHEPTEHYLATADIRTKMAS